MAFATSNIRKGTCGDLKITAGNWTGSAGDANGTFPVEGGQVYLARFEIRDSSGGPAQIVPVFYSSNPGAGVITLSIANRSAVTTGTFYVVHA